MGWPKLGAGRGRGSGCGDVPCLHPLGILEAGVQAGQLLGVGRPAFFRDGIGAFAPLYGGFLDVLLRLKLSQNGVQGGRAI